MAYTPLVELSPVGGCCYHMCSTQQDKLKWKIESVVSSFNTSHDSLLWLVSTRLKPHSRDNSTAGWFDTSALQFFFFDTTVVCLFGIKWFQVMDHRFNQQQQQCAGLFITAIRMSALSGLP